MNDKDIANFKLVLAFLGVCALLSAMIVGMAGTSGSSSSKSLDDLYESNYRYEKEQQKTQDYIEYQREIGKIKSGYYD